MSFLMDDPRAAAMNSGSMYEFMVKYMGNMPAVIANATAAQAVTMGNLPDNMTPTQGVNLLALTDITAATAAVLAGTGATGINSAALATKVGKLANMNTLFIDVFKTLATAAQGNALVALAGMDTNFYTPFAAHFTTAAEEAALHDYANMNTLFVTQFKTLATAAQGNALVALAGLDTLYYTPYIAGANAGTPATNAANIVALMGWAKAAVDQLKAGVDNAAKADRLVTLTGLTAGQATAVVAMPEAAYTALTTMGATTIGKIDAVSDDKFDALTALGHANTIAQLENEPLANWCQSGSFTASVGETGIYTANFAGSITSVYLGASQTGIDGTDALSFELDVLIDGTSVYAGATKPKITQAAGGGRHTTYGAGGGITVGVLGAGVAFTAGQVISFTITLVRTTPDTEASGLFFVVNGKRTA